jgi:hypothetical protein
MRRVIGTPQHNQGKADQRDRNGEEHLGSLPDDRPSVFVIARSRVGV